jgi:tRNA pseudouridine38-40 synthase
VRCRLDLGYDGTAFHGWARQPGLRTVQGEIERALGRVLRLDAPPSLTVAGRTDAGVHATGQVAHTELPGDAELAALTRRLARLLPTDVRVWAVSAAPAGFDARFSALSRRYVYRVADAPYGVDPLRRQDTLAWRRPLDGDRLREAAAALLGEHDFAAYCRPREGATTIRRLLRLDWDREPAGVWVSTVEADAFCHGMVRSLLGALLAVGDGRQPASWPAEVLARGVRDSAVTVVPAHGLTLARVRYPEDAGLAARAEQTRRRRDRSDS